MITISERLALAQLVVQAVLIVGSLLMLMSNQGWAWFIVLVQAMNIALSQIKAVSS